MSTTVWRPGPVIDWLVHEGLRIDNPRRFVDELCPRLIADGIPIWRFASYIGTLHPEIYGYAYIWERGKQRTRFFRARHEFIQTEEFQRSPLHLARETMATLHFRLDNAAAVEKYPLLTELKEVGGTDYLAIPYKFSNGQVNYFTMASDAADGFENGHVTVFEDLVRLLQWYAEAHALQQLAVDLLNTYVGRISGERVLKGQILRGSGETIRAAIWYCDLRGFTALSERLERDELIALLNDYFGCMGAAVSAYEGEILKFIGDAMLAIFPLGADRHEGTACRAALNAARSALTDLKELNARRSAAGVVGIDVGIGLHVGDVMYGNIGATDRLDFTVIGPAVNLAERIQELCRTAGRPLLASARFAEACGGSLTSLGWFRLRGRDNSLEVFAPTPN